MIYKVINIPDIYPDELFYSFYCRYHLKCGSRNVKTTNRILWSGKQKCFCSLLFPTSLHDVVLATNTRLLSDESIINHTALPFYKNFMTQKDYEGCLKHALYGGNGIYSNVRALVGNEFCPYIIKYCPVCQKEKPLTISGALSPAFVKVCPKHKCMLLTRKTEIEHLTGNLLALTGKDYDNTLIPCRDEKEIRLAKMAEYFFHLKGINIDLLKDVLNNKVEEYKCTCNQNINIQKFMKNIKIPLDYIDSIVKLYDSIEELDQDIKRQLNKWNKITLKC